MGDSDDILMYRLTIFVVKNLKTLAASSALKRPGKIISLTSGRKYQRIILQEEESACRDRKIRSLQDGQASSCSNYRHEQEF